MADLSQTHFLCKKCEKPFLYKDVESHMSFCEAQAFGCPLKCQSSAQMKTLDEMKVHLENDCDKIN